MESTPARDVSDVIDYVRDFATAFGAADHPELRGITDGKAVGTYVERRLKEALMAGGLIGEVEGNAAFGVDLPSFNTDIKVTSVRQPQSSSPFVSFRQKVEGLGYNLLLLVYDKVDDTTTSRLTFVALRLIPARLTGDYQITRQLRRLILEENGNEDDVFALLSEKKIPADDESLRRYAEGLLRQPPEQGWLTISNAQQWRLQYGRVVTGGIEGITEI